MDLSTCCCPTRTGGNHWMTPLPFPVKNRPLRASLAIQITDRPHIKARFLAVTISALYGQLSPY